MQKTLGVALLGLALASLHPPEAAAQTYEALGTRAAGMGGAFVAVADDASAVYWNPAGLAAGSFLSLVLDRNSSESIWDDRPIARSESAMFVAVAVPALGVSYYRLRATNVAQSAGTVAAESLVTHHTGITLVQSLTEGISIGTTLKFVRGVAAVDLPPTPASTEDLLDRAEHLDGSSSNEFDADIGILARFGTLRAGLTLRNVREPDFELPGGETALQLDRQIRGGVALTLATNLVVAADFDFVRVPGAAGEVRNVALGAEGRVTSRGLVRGGVRFNTLGDQPGGRTPVGTAGGSFAVLASVFIEGQATFGGERAARGWGVAGRVIF
jgi:hypothetical protein